MGQGGFITLVNATNSNWKRTGQHSYQMNSWNFPETILANTNKRIYVEWNQGIFHTQSDDAGEAVYRLEGENDIGFQVQARAKHRFDLQINFDKLETNNHPLGSVLNLGWVHNGTINFLLSEPKKTYEDSFWIS